MTEQTEVNYSKRIFTLLIIVFLIGVIYLAREILFPLVLAFIFAILIRPIDSFLQRKWRFPKIISVIVTELLLISFFAGLLLLIGDQLKQFVADFPETQDRFVKVLHQISDWIYHNFGVSVIQQEKYLKQNLMDMQVVSMESVGSLSNVVTYFTLLPIYIFLFLFYRNLLLTFLLKLVDREKTEKMQIVVNDIKFIVRRYIIGLLLEVVVVASLMFIGFSILGVKFALFLALLTAMLNLIPYIGIIVAMCISCLVAFSFNANPEESILGVIAVTAVVQFIDNMILMPRIVGNNVRINALASILSVIVGGALAGVPGMFLAIPTTAIIKVIFDAVPTLEPYGYLLGDEMSQRIFWTKKSELKQK